MDANNEIVETVHVPVWIEGLGWLGALFLLAGYYLIQIHEVDRYHKMYVLLNTVGAFALMVNTWYHKAYPSFVTNLIWTFFGMWGVYMGFRA